VDQSVCRPRSLSRPGHKSFLVPPGAARVPTRKGLASWTPASQVNEDAGRGGATPHLLAKATMPQGHDEDAALEAR
jgi:hypothetical protein